MRGEIIVLAWPETPVRMAGGLYDKPLQWLGINRSGYYQAGHSALVLVHPEDGRCAYYDFGRYVTPLGKGRVRSAQTDVELEMPLKAQYNTSGKILNLPEILTFLAGHEPTHGTGVMYASVCSVDAKRAERWILELQAKGSIPYGPFVQKGSNCSRFVADAVLNSSKDRLVKWLVRWPFYWTPSPLGNVFNASSDGMAYRVKGRKVEPFLFGKKESIAKVANYFFGTPDKVAGGNGEGTLVPPRKPEWLPKNAQWLGGIGAGAWYYLKEEKNSYRYQVFAPNGERLFDSLMSPDKPFDFREAFEFVYDSHCAFCTVRQGGREIRFYPRG